MKTPCCGYNTPEHFRYPVFFNPGNKVVQCHNCGEIFLPASRINPTGGTCVFAGYGRGDCAHFVRLPPKLDSSNTDSYGKPHGWCWQCWKSHQIEQLKGLK